MSCGACLGTIFLGAKYCPLCGDKAVHSKKVDVETIGDCPRCKKKMALLEVANLSICECEKCEGVWLDVETFEEICSNQEKQAAVLKKFDEILSHKKPIPVHYVPCPECKDLMNRSNFARISGIIIDSCKQHGIWFDADELPKIVEFIRKGGMDKMRDKEKLEIQSEKEQIRYEKFKQSVEQHRHSGQPNEWSSGGRLTIREFIRFLFD